MKFLVALGILLASSAAIAEPIIPETGKCATHDQVVEMLTFGFGETLASSELVEASGTLVEVYISVEKKTLTVVEVFPDQTTCYRAFNDSTSPWGARAPGGRDA